MSEHSSTVFNVTDRDSNADPEWLSQQSQSIQLIVFGIIGTLLTMATVHLSYKHLKAGQKSRRTPSLPIHNLESRNSISLPVGFTRRTSRLWATVQEEYEYVIFGVILYRVSVSFGRREAMPQGFVLNVHDPNNWQPATSPIRSDNRSWNSNGEAEATVWQHGSFRLQVTVGIQTKHLETKGNMYIGMKDGVVWSRKSRTAPKHCAQPSATLEGAWE
ncbi:hypothetical protein B0T21DRAFT_94839 [Apiosordaria backusii]|uniref:Uncharacterized protein n=1 Tax=Apiosordaria backusii TaxID=314023 RepID=A0AA40K3W5_9PEZI|nr:hypothetical protein B0T21DRAFT_94839 [Apiosordaria backusii]